MYSPYYFSKHLVFVYIFAIQLLLIGNVSSMNLTNAYLQHKCLANEGKYKPGSEFEKNLNFLTRRLGAQSYRDGFEHISYGDDPNSVTFVFQCRGDSYGPKCRSCFATAVAGLRRRCPSYKGAIIWYDQCFLDISTIKSPPESHDYENTFSMHNPNNVIGDKESFNKIMRDFLYKLAVKADTPPANSKTLLYYAAGEERLGTTKLYAMVQCTQDKFYCKTCLEWCIKELSKCCDGKQGARILGTSCNLRYELYPFIKT